MKKHNWALFIEKDSGGYFQCRPRDEFSLVDDAECFSCGSVLKYEDVKRNLSFFGNCWSLIKIMDYTMNGRC
jgi:hypothetical protein